MSAAAGPVADAAAAYTQQGSKLTQAGTIEFGSSVAISADAGTALVGGIVSGTPEVFVYIRSGSTWTRQATLTGAPSTAFGSALALSANGNTALIGASETVGGAHSLSNFGAAWVYTRTGTSWSGGQAIQPTDETNGACYNATLMSYVTCATFGGSAALSSDGTEALIGGPGDGGSSNAGGTAVGSVWVYTESGGNWTEATKISPTDETGAAFGSGAALSTNGQTALIGGGHAEAWIYAGSGASWTEQQKLSLDSSPIPERSYALSGNGSTVVVGDGSNANNTLDNDGAVLVFDRNPNASSNPWSQTATLKNAANTGCAAQPICDHFGDALAISSDGDTMLVGGPAATRGNGVGDGAVWAFTRASSAAGWTQGPTIAPNDESGQAYFGGRIALSSSASTALIGGDLDNADAGAAWVFFAPNHSFVVNSTGDAADANPADGSCDTGQTVSGGAAECTLRAAIQEANAGGGGTITFNLAAPDTTISPKRDLPALTTPITITGSSGQPVIDGSQDPVPEHLETTSTGLYLASSGDLVTGLTIKSFWDQLAIGAAGHASVSELQLGPSPAVPDTTSGYSQLGCKDSDASAATPPPEAGIVASGPANQIGPADQFSEASCRVLITSSSNTVTGLSDAQRSNPVTAIDGDGNTIASINGGGIDITGASNTVQSSFVLGISVSGNGNTIGAPGGSPPTLPASGNTIENAPDLSGGPRIEITGDDDVIEGNLLTGGPIGLQLSGQHNAVHGNSITKISGTDASSDGAVLLHAAAANTVEGNAIFDNAGPGIDVLGNGSTGNTFTGNEIYDNRGLGIDLGGTGHPSHLDGSPLFPTFGPNALLSYPSFVSATDSGGQLRLQGSLEGVLGGAGYTIAVFSNDKCNASGYGEGQHMIGTVTVNTNGVGRLTGEAEFDKTLPLHGAPATNISATTTDHDGNTSEFAACVTGTASLKANLKKRLRAAAQELDAGASAAAGAEGTSRIAGSGGINVGGVTPAPGSYTATGTTTSSAPPSHARAMLTKARTVTVMSGTVKVKRPGLFTLKIKLTKAGRALLRKAKTVRLTLTISYVAKPNRGKLTTRITITRGHGKK